MRNMNHLFNFYHGKSMVSKEIVDSLPKDIHTFYEPMLGSGAVSLLVMSKIDPVRIIMSDINPHIVWAAKAMKEHAQNLISHVLRLDEMTKGYDPLQKNTFLHSLQSKYLYKPNDEAEAAAWFLLMIHNTKRSVWNINSSGRLAKQTKSNVYSTQAIISKINNINIVLNSTNSELEFHVRDVFDLKLDRGVKNHIYLDPPVPNLPERSRAKNIAWITNLFTYTGKWINDGAGVTITYPELDIGTDPAIALLELGYTKKDLPLDSLERSKDKFYIYRTEYTDVKGMGKEINGHRR
jgi:site-specific DNA-adenine methylase